MNLIVKDVHFTYPSGAYALRGVSLSLGSGESVAIIGENGAGKSTLAKHLNGLLEADKGDVLVGDVNTRDRTVAQMAPQVGFVFQNPDEQVVERRVHDEVAFGPRHIGQSDEEIERNVTAALEMVGLSDEADTHPYDLSASQRKLMTLASVLAMQTPVVVFDEPTMGQDSRGIAIVAAVIESLKAGGRTLLTITHDIDFCAAHFERVVVLADGQLLADGPAAEILGQTDLLAQTHVTPPQLVRLAQGLGLPATPLTTDEFVTALENGR